MRVMDVARPTLSGGPGASTEQGAPTDSLEPVVLRLPERPDQSPTHTRSAPVANLTGRSEEEPVADHLAQPGHTRIVERPREAGPEGIGRDQLAADPVADVPAVHDL